MNGEVSLVDDTTIEITELPIRKWTQDYKEDVVEPMLNSTDKSPALITYEVLAKSRLARKNLFSHRFGHFNFN